MNKREAKRQAYGIAQMRLEQWLDAGDRDFDDVSLEAAVREIAAQMARKARAGADGGERRGQ